MLLFYNSEFNLVHLAVVYCTQCPLLSTYLCINLQNRYLYGGCRISNVWEGGCPSVTSAAVAISLVSPRSLILKLIRRQFFSTASRRHASFRACSLLPMEYNSPSSRKIEMDWIAIFVHAARAPATVERRKTCEARKPSNDIGLFGANDELYPEGRLALYILLLSVVAGAGAACTKIAIIMDPHRETAMY